MKRLALLGALVLLVMAIAVPASAQKPDKHWVCHETHSVTNPWILVHVNEGWDAGHGNGGPSSHQNDDFEIFNYTGKAGPAAGALECGGGGGPV